MKKLVLLFVGTCAIACTPAELQKANETVDKIQAQVNCRADVLQPYIEYFTKDNLAAALQTAKAPVEALEAVQVAAEEVMKVKETFEACSK